MRGRYSHRASRCALLAIVLTGVGVAAPSPATAQFSAPCGIGCALTLSATSVTFATGAMTAVGRARGGYSSSGQAIRTWGAGFVLAAAAGVALNGDGERQRRAVYGSAFGLAGGAMLGLALESTIGESSPTTRLAATLIGAGAGVLLGGAIGALTHDDPMPVVSVGFHF